MTVLNGFLSWIGSAIVVLGVLAGIVLPTIFHLASWISVLIGAAAVVAVLAEGSYRLWDKESRARLTVQPLAPLGMRETGVSVALLQQPAAGIGHNNDDRLLVVAVSAPASRGLTNCSAQIEEFIPEGYLEHRPFSRDYSPAGLT